MTLIKPSTMKTHTNLIKGIYLVPAGKINPVPDKTFPLNKAAATQERFVAR
jgi:hypothetical protein